MTKALSDLAIGTTGTIDTILADGSFKYRLMDMGFVKGTQVTVTKVAPFGNPIQLRLKGYQLCIRKEDAKNILVNL